MRAILQPTGADYRDIQLLVDSPARGLLVQWGFIDSYLHTRQAIALLLPKLHHPDGVSCDTPGRTAL